MGEAIKKLRELNWLKPIIITFFLTVLLSAFSGGIVISNKTATLETKMEQIEQQDFVTRQEFENYMKTIDDKLNTLKDADKENGKKLDKLIDMHIK